MERINSIENWDLYHKIMGTPTIWETEYKFQKKKRVGVLKKLCQWLKKNLSSIKGK